MGRSIFAKVSISAINLLFFSHRKCLDLILIFIRSWGLGRVKGEPVGNYRRMAVLVVWSRTDAD
jgi:hypothetical protein